jgi:Response regulator containing CheY-like receiver, AAA-type ATPase, and DNA-binding domains
MTLRPSLLRELENSNLSVSRRVELCCALARDFEDRGEYEEARKALSDYWRRIGEEPKLSGLEPSAAAELLLRAGVLTGYVGGKNQIADAQERAKDLITQSHAIFEARQNRKHIAEAQTELALIYWRTGENNEARDCLKDALALLNIDSDLKAKAVIRLAVVEFRAARHEKALRILRKHAPLFDRIHNHTLKGSYHDTLGNTLEDLSVLKKRRDYLDRALIEYAAASFHFEQAGHRGYLAYVENNLGMLYFRINQCDEAHEHLDRARGIFRSLKDAGCVAQVDETRACVLLRQGHFVEAEHVARSAVRNQEKTNRLGQLAEALTTHGRALARLERYGASLSAFRRAIALYEHTDNMTRAAEVALAMVQEIGEQLAAPERGELLSGRALGEDKLALEHHVIKLALEHANGRISRAAQLAGMSWQALAYALRTRHKDLLNLRTPPRHRRQK